jgi:aldose 1-epimerase
MSGAVLPTGEQWTLRHVDADGGTQELVVVEVGGGIRTYSRGGHDVVFGFGAEEQCSSGRGQILMPWPNRVRDGAWSYGGRDLQLALTEPARHNATHGLVRWAIWSVAQDPARSDSSITLTCKLRAQQGWPWALDLTLTYSLGDDGLTVTPTAVNVGANEAPFGFGAHPYLTAGEQRVDELELRIPAAARLEVDDRLLPIQVLPVEGTDYDFRMPRPLAQTVLDTAFTQLDPDDDGRWRVTLASSASGRRSTLWGDAGAYPWLQVFSGDALPEAQKRRTGVAVEPMTCPPGALNSGQDLLALAPGERFSAPWGIS